MIEHVLAAIDFSPAWPRLRQRLVSLKALGVRQITLVYVMSSRYPAAPQEAHRSHYQQRLAEEAESLSSNGIEADYRIVVGEPGQELVSAAESIGADLLLLGDRGHGKVHEFLIGSTALDAARLTTLPLWLEPIHEDFIEKRDVLLLATDGSAHAGAAEAWLMHLAPHYRRYVAITACNANENEACERSDAQAHLATLAERINGLEARIESSDPRDAVVELARELPADLILIGKRGRNAIKQLLLGSTAEAVCRRARRPVLLVPASI